MDYVITGISVISTMPEMHFDTSSKAILLGVELSTEKQERIALVLSQFDKLDDGFLKEKGAAKVIDDECRREAKKYM